MGWLSVMRVSAFISVAPSKCQRWLRGKRERNRRVDRAGEEVGQAVRNAVARRADQAARAVERTALELEAEQTILLVGAGQPQRAGFLGREPETAVIGRIADQQHRSVLARPCLTQRALHQYGADAAIARVRRDRERTEEQRWAAKARVHVPQAHTTDDAAVRRDDERQSVGR